MSLYSRPPKKSIFSFSTSCVHSPIPRIPSPYCSRQTPGARLKQVVSSSSRTFDTDITGTEHTLRRPGPMAVNKAGHLKRRSKGMKDMTNSYIIIPYVFVAGIPSYLILGCVMSQSK